MTTQATVAGSLPEKDAARPSPESTAVRLRIPQARILKALMPAGPDGPCFDWPLLTRSALAERAGYTAISGSVTRALNGIRPNSSSGEAHRGLIDLGFVEIVTVDVDGPTEVNYQLTAAGLTALQEFLSGGGSLPAVKDAALCTNTRYSRQ